MKVEITKWPMKGGSSTVDQSVWPMVSVIVRKRFVNRWVRPVPHRNWCRKMHWTQTPKEFPTVVEIDLFDLLWRFSLHYKSVKLPSPLQLFWLSFLSKICLCYLIILNFINHRMRGLSVRDRRLWSLGGALRSFLRLDLRAQLMRGPGVQGSRWWYLDGALRSFLRLGVGMHSLRPCVV